jgi:hypothetical protein
MLSKSAGFLLLLLALGAVQANADSVYEISGTLTIPGNSSNLGVSETINYSFDLDYTRLIGGLPTIVGAPTINSSGPLGTFLFGAPGGSPDGAAPSNPYQGYVGFFSPSVEIDLFGSFAPVYGLVPVPREGQGAAAIYSCFLSPTVCSEFYPSGNSAPDTGGQGLYWYGMSDPSVYAVTVPEPGGLCLSVLGPLALCLIKKTLER